jgi:hypothetical protein
MLRASHALIRPRRTASATHASTCYVASSSVLQDLALKL